MSEKFKNWKKDLESMAAEEVEPSKGEIDEVVHNAAVQMGDTEGVEVGIGTRPIEETIKELEVEGWHYRGPVSGEAVFEAVAEEDREIKIIGTGTQRFIFEREKSL
jgi:hypothetical protein